MEVWDRSDVPGVASQRTRLEGAKIVDEMADDYFHKFVREGEGRFVRGKGLWGRVAEQEIDLGFASIPNNAGQEGYPCDVGKTEIRNAHVRWQIVVPDTEDIGVFERPRFPVVADMADVG